MIHPKIQKSIETQNAARVLNISKIKMHKVVLIVEKSFPHHSPEIMAEDIKDLSAQNGIDDIKDWDADEIAGFLVDIWNEILV